ncbi:MAG TPA: HAMP domain-containing sensor histidine kinase [Planctomycetota bacterium]
MSLRSRMIGGVTGVLLLVWALVTLNLMVDGYARQRAHAQDKARFLGILLEAWVNEARDPSGGMKDFERRLSDSGLVDGWLIASRDRGRWTVRSSRPVETAVPLEDAPHLQAALDSEHIQVKADTDRRIAYLRIAGGPIEVYAVRLDLKPDLVPASPITNTLWASVAILVLGAVTLVLLTYALLNRLVLEPLSSMVEASRRVSEGDYSRRIPPPARGDEVATMIQAFNSMMEKLDAYHQTLQEDIKKARDRITNTERKLFHAQRLSTTGTLAAGIAHEINNPLGGMMNAAGALRSGKLDPAKQAEYLELISDGLSRIRGIVQKILHYRPMAFQAVPVSLRETVVRSIAFLEHKARQRRVEIRNDVDPALPPVHGDPLELQQAFLNILMNAVDACEEGKGRIRVSHEIVGDDVRISISDNGIGMTPEEADRALDPFYTTKDAGEGSGLGLPVASSIVENHGGRLRIRSRKGEGTEVTIELPLGPAPGGARAPAVHI